MVVPGSAADEAGLLVGDVIFEVDGKALTTKLGDLLKTAKYKKASSFKLTVQRAAAGVAQAELAPLEMEGGIKLQEELTVSI